MARKLCVTCQDRPVARLGEDQAANSAESCTPCFDEAGWENSHSDGGHDSLKERLSHDGYVPTSFEQAEMTEMDKCWICHPELNDALVPRRRGHTDGIAKSHGSHAGHKHPATKAARAACRKAAKA